MSLTATSRPATTSLDAVVFATLREAAAALRARQRDDGSWQCDTDIGPIGLATQLITERLLGAGDPDEARPALRYFARRQRDDGSFPPYPGAPHGSVTVTALCEAALIAVGIAEGHAVVQRARRYVDAHGGETAVVEAFRSRGDPAALYLVAAGRIDGDFLPRLPPGIALAAHGRVLRSRVHAGNVMTMLVLAALAERSRSRGGLLASARRAASGVGIPEYLCRWQNADGSWNGSPLQTTLMLVGLHAAGMTAHDRPVSRALAWLRTMKRRNNDELDVSAMDNDVWSTALCALALHELEEPPEGPVLGPAVEYLLSCQCDEPMPKENQRRIGALRVGGWPFQRGNESMPDTDDTGVVLAVLATLAGERSRRAQFQAIDDGVAWVLDMQNDDGGFPTFVWGLPSKKPGPMFDRELPIRLDDAGELVRSFFEPAPEYGDPALEGVTGRVLWGLGAAGLDRDHPAVSRAIEFLREQQLPDGSWWGRWKACYLAETATIVLGLSSVGEDPDAPWVRRALDWIVAHQNDDGGFGESADAYVDERLAGCGPSSAAVTAYALLGLLAAGRGRTEAAAAAARWLLCNRSNDGLWSNAGWLHTFIPPELLYTYPIPAQALPIVALARWARAQR